MAYSQQNLYCDTTTLANFISTSSAISSFVGSCGFFTKAGDTGQVNWGTLAAVPTGGNYVYEMWQSNDGLATFYLKLEYGQVTGGTGNYGFRCSIGTATNGAGTLTGFFTGTQQTISGGLGSNSSTPFECTLFGLAGVMGALMWRNIGTSNTQLFAVERSLDSSDNYTSDYVTLYTTGNGPFWSQVTLHLTAGVVSPYTGNNVANGPGVRAHLSTTLSGAFQNKIPFDFFTPRVGLWDRPGTILGLGNSADYTEGVQFNLDGRGPTKTYIPSAASNFNRGPLNSNGNWMTCMRTA